MSQQSCNACNDLREYAPEFVVNGVTDDVCDNLASNEGLSGADAHNDCDDLHDVNDCLIGNMDDELESFEICDWKDFMHQYIPNNYETLKAMICSMCGQWDKLEDMCALISSILQPGLVKYGSLPHSSYTARRCGVIPNKNGQPIMKAHSNPHPSGSEQYNNFNEWQNVGIQYARRKVNSCADGSCKLYEWFEVDVYAYDINENVEYKDVLWYCDKATFQSTVGWSDSLWHTYTVSAWTWKEYVISSGAEAGKNVWLRLTVDPGGMGTNYIGIEYRGTSYPRTALTEDAEISAGSNMVRTHISNC